jgi:hydrogenase expression/formation protein HypC
MQVDLVNEDGTGVVSLNGASTNIRLSLLDNVAIGDYVIVHAGFAIERLDRADADERLALFRQLAQSIEEPGRPS